MFKGKPPAKSHRNPNIPADLISDELAEIIHAQRCFEESASLLVKLSKRYEDTISELSKARLKLREELLSLPLFKTRKLDSKNPEKQSFDARIDQFRKSADMLVEQGKYLVSLQSFATIIVSTPSMLFSCLSMHRKRTTMELSMTPHVST
jgi:hypothetical protein